MWKQRFRNVGLELAYFSGIAHASVRRAGGAGVILRFRHVRPRRMLAFQPLRSSEITPDFLERAIRALKRWNLDLISIEQAKLRSQLPVEGKRFVALTFDGGFRDFMTHAYPILRRHEAPFALYVPTGFIDGVGQAWWLALEAIVARNHRIILVMNSEERRFALGTVQEKTEAYTCIADWMRTLAPRDLTTAMGDLCTRYDVDLKAISSRLTMSWKDILELAADPLATLGSATVNYPVLSSTKGSTVSREMEMGRATLEAAIGRSCPHFAFPFGDAGSFGARDVLLAREAGFSTAVSSIPGVISGAGQDDLMSLPRIDWEGRSNSIRALRVVLSGLTMPRRREKVPEEV